MVYYRQSGYRVHCSRLSSRFLWRRCSLILLYYYCTRSLNRPVSSVTSCRQFCSIARTWCQITYYMLLCIYQYFIFACGVKKKLNLWCNTIILYLLSRLQLFYSVWNNVCCVIKFTSYNLRFRVLVLLSNHYVNPKYTIIHRWNEIKYKAVFYASDPNW